MLRPPQQQEPHLLVLCLQGWVPLLLQELGLELLQQQQLVQPLAALHVLDLMLLRDVLVLAALQLDMLDLQPVHI